MSQAAVQQSPDLHPSNLAPMEMLDTGYALTKDSNNKDFAAATNPTSQSFAMDNDDEIQSLLLRHEKKSASGGGVLGSQKIVIPGAVESDDQSDSSDSDMEDASNNRKKNNGMTLAAGAVTVNSTSKGHRDEEMSSDDDGDIPVVKVGREEYAITDVMNNQQIIGKMTAEEKDRYIQISQDFYSSVYE